MNYPEQIERLISISKNKPLLPESFIPWNVPATPAENYLPTQLVSLYGLPEYDQLSGIQKRELGRHEVVQAMYSYGWTEALFCMFMNRYILSLKTQSVEYRFLLRELIEEFRHQEMFNRAIEQLEGDALLPSKIHKFLGLSTVRFFPPDVVFISCLAVEMMADLYGDHLRKGENIYPVLKKVSELHNIEEARHILFTKLFLKKYTSKAGFIKRCVYSYIILMNIYFMRSLYVKKEIFERIGCSNSKVLYRKAFQNYKIKFGAHCLGDIKGFVSEINGFNWATRWAWRKFLNTKI
ncbi:MAG: diiron oxygenase [Ginsengibacter sp.]